MQGPASAKQMNAQTRITAKSRTHFMRLPYINVGSQFRAPEKNSRQLRERRREVTDFAVGITFIFLRPRAPGRRVRGIRARARTESKGKMKDRRRFHKLSNKKQLCRLKTCCTASRFLQVSLSLSVSRGTLPALRLH